MYSYSLLNLSYLTVNVNQNNIRSNLTNILKWNYNVWLTIQEAQYPVISRNHDFANTATAGIKLQIANPTQLFAILDVDDILTFQFGKKHRFNRHPFLPVYAIIICP